jgi:uncharacterized protein (TIGR03435 family)
MAFSRRRCSVTVALQDGDRFSSCGPFQQMHQQHPRAVVGGSPCTTVRFLIQTAYVRYADGQAGPTSQLKNQPVEGGPSWIDTERFLIDAKPETPQARATMGGPMLQGLLEERFKLKIHRETRKVPAYALVVAKGGPKLQATPDCGCTPGAAGSSRVWPAPSLRIHRR